MHDFIDALILKHSISGWKLWIFLIFWFVFHQGKMNGCFIKHYTIYFTVK